MKNITKAQALSTFRELWNELVKHDRILRGDTTAKREAFNDFVDDLYRQRYITDYQVRLWVNPF